MEEQNSFGMMKLNSENYAIWKRKMLDLLYCKDLFLPILGKEKPTEKSDDDWAILHMKASATIRQWVDPNIFHHIAEETKTDVLLKKLEALYEKNTFRNKALLIRRLVNLKFKDGKSMTKHTIDFVGLVNQLTGMKLKLEDELQALLFLGSLPDSWETLVVSLSTSAPGGTLTMEMIKDSLHCLSSKFGDGGSSYSALS